METALKPCPFCGSKDIFIKRYEFEGDWDYTIYVRNVIVIWMG